MSTEGNPDANLSPDMRALVVVLREIRDEGRRVADALERIAEGVNPPGDWSVAKSLTSVALDVARTVAK